MFRLILVALLLPLVCQSVAAAAPNADETVRSASKVLAEIRGTPGKQIPNGVLERAQAVVIVPDAIKVGLIGGVRTGTGVALLRQADGSWGLPEFVHLSGGSVGFQAGVEDVDMLLVFTTPQSAQGLLSGKFTVGTDAAASAGPVGRDSESVTDGKAQSEILTYTRNRGLFVGASVDGARLQIDAAIARAYYGGPPNQPGRVPQAAAALRDQLVSAAKGEALAGPVGPRYDPQPQASKSKPYRRRFTGMGGAGGTGGAGT